MSVAKPIDTLAVGLMLLLCTVWGFQQITLKATAHDITPLMQISVRSGLAALLVVGLMWWRKEGFGFVRQTWRPGMIAGSLFTLEFILVGEGLRLTTASHMVVFLYTAPIFAALGLHWKVPSERLSRLEWIGIGIAFLGLAIAFLWRENHHEAYPHMLLGDLLGLMGGMAWGATTVVVRTSNIAKLPATQTLLYQLLVCCVALGALAGLLGQSDIHWTGTVLASVSFQAVIVSFASFLTWFWMLRIYPASRLGVFAFMTPLFGVGFGIWLLREDLAQGFISGALLVVCGIILVSGADWFRQLRQS